MDFPVEKIQTIIYTIRKQRVMLDSDLAKLYGVETKALNRQVRRHLSRFPADFLIEPNLDELEDLRYQIGAANSSNNWNYKRRTIPMLFTENGVAMLSTVLGSERSIQINIAIMRTFTKLKIFMAMENSIEGRVEDLEKGTHKLFKIVFERLDTLEDQITPKLPNNRKRIGLQVSKKL